MAVQGLKLERSGDRQSPSTTGTITAILLLREIIGTPCVARPNAGARTCRRYYGLMHQSDGLLISRLHCLVPSLVSSCGS